MIIRGIPRKLSKDAWWLDDEYGGLMMNDLSQAAQIA